MIQSKSKSELGFHFHFVSFHFTSFRFNSAHFHFISCHFISFSFWFLFHFHFHVPSGFICGFILFRFFRRSLSGSLGLYFFQFFCKPTAEAMRKQFGSFAEAGTLISQSDRQAGEFLRFRQISAEAKPPRIRIMRKACGSRWGRFGIMFEFPAEAKPLENRI